MQQTASQTVIAKITGVRFDIGDNQMVRRADLLNKTKRGRILRSPVEEALPEPVVEVVDQTMTLTLTFNELRALCKKERGLDAKGKKAELIAKLSDSGDGESDEESE